MATWGFIDEEVRLTPNSKIAELIGESTARVRSAHHQAVDVPGNKLKVAAYAQDGNIEAIEHTDKAWVVGLQWHPEETSANESHRRLILQDLLAHAKQRTPHEPVLQK